jgi:hypothetical protein
MKAVLLLLLLLLNEATQKLTLQYNLHLQSAMNNRQQNPT